VYVYATHDEPAGGRAPDGELAELRRIFAAWHDPIPDLIGAATDESIIRSDCHDIRPLPAWHRGRVVLLGDAAHAMTPNLGQGACQALEDAVVLGRRLAVEPTVEAAVAGYEAERRPRAVRFQKRSWSAGAMGQWRNPVALGLRALITRTLLPRLQAAEMRGLLEVEL